MRHDIAATLFKDFTINCYQVTIECSARQQLKIHYINVIKLFYDCSYSSVILDVEQILI